MIFNDAQRCHCIHSVLQHFMMCLTQDHVWLLEWGWVVFIFPPPSAFLFLGTSLQRQWVLTPYAHFSIMCSDLPPLPKGPCNFTLHKFTSQGLAKSVKSRRFPWQTQHLPTGMGWVIHWALVPLLQAPSVAAGPS